MKKVKTIAVIITIFFCIDYSVSVLLHWNLCYSYAQKHDIAQNIYAFVIGVCGFLAILSLKKEDD